jgi:hypothetical protein
MRNGDARSAIRLLRTGIVPGLAIDSLSVGYTRFRSEVTSKLDEFTKGKNQKPLFVHGEWGAGKSHCLSYLRSLAADVALPTALVSVNARTVALNYPQRIYGEISASLGIGHLRGLRPLLHALLVDPNLRAKLTHHTRTLSNDPLSWALLRLLEHYDRNDAFSPTLEFAWAQLLGEDLGWADYGYKREQALLRVESLAQCLRAVNGAGLVLLFDEVETIDQLWNYRSRLVAYEVMARFAQMPSIWTIFAVTARFDKVVAMDGPRAEGNARWLLQGLGAGTFARFETPTLDRSKASGLAGAVAKLYCEAYPSTRIADSQIESCVEEWGRNPSRNPRRLIRLIVNRLDLSRPL